MREVGLERTALVGNSFGYQIIADLAVRHPERFERAVLQGPTMDPQARTVIGKVRRFVLDAPPRTPLPLPDRTPRLHLGRSAVLDTCGLYTVW